MKDLLAKLSSYNIFNYLLPGVLFALLAEKVSRHSFLQQDILLGLFLYYFIGLVISRLGSVLLEPLLRKLSFLRFAPYKDFVTAAKVDQKLDLLSEVNNTYRTLCALFATLLLLRLYDSIERQFPALNGWSSVLLLIFLLVLFLFAYRKQTSYITKRIDANR